MHVKRIIHGTVKSDPVSFFHSTKRQNVCYPLWIVPDPSVSRQVTLQFRSFHSSIASDPQRCVALMNFCKQFSVAEHINGGLTIQQHPAYRNPASSFRRRGPLRPHDHPVNVRLEKHKLLMLITTVEIIINKQFIVSTDLVIHIYLLSHGV